MAPTYVDHVFPQDGDRDDAANIAQLHGDERLLDYVIDGLKPVNVDYTAGTFDVSEGVSRHFLSSGTSPSTGEDRIGLGFTAQLAERTGLTLGTGSRYVYVDPQIETDDAPRIVVGDVDTATEDGWLLIAIIDTGSQTVAIRNREPEALPLLVAPVAQDYDDSTDEYRLRDTTNRDSMLRLDRATGDTTLTGGLDAVTEARVDGNEVYHTGNDGAGSGIDADLLDGFHADEVGIGVSDGGQVIAENAGIVDLIDNLTVTDDGTGTASLSASTGSGSGLDADLVDGVQSENIGSDVGEDGAIVLEPARSLDFDGPLSVTDNTDGTATVDTTHDHDSRYHTKGQMDNRFIKLSDLSIIVFDENFTAPTDKESFDDQSNGGLKLTTVSALNASDTDDNIKRSGNDDFLQTAFQGYVLDIEGSDGILAGASFYVRNNTNDDLTVRVHTFVVKNQSVSSVVEPIIGQEGTNQ